MGIPGVNNAENANKITAGSQPEPWTNPAAGSIKPTDDLAFSPVSVMRSGIVFGARGGKPIDMLRRDFLKLTGR